MEQPKPSSLCVLSCAIDTEWLHCLLEGVQQALSSHLLPLLDACSLALLSCTSRQQRDLVYNAPLDVWVNAAKAQLPIACGLPDPCTRTSLQGALLRYKRYSNSATSSILQLLDLLCMTLLWHPDNSGYFETTKNWRLSSRQNEQVMSEMLQSHCQKGHSHLSGMKKKGIGCLLKQGAARHQALPMASHHQLELPSAPVQHKRQLLSMLCGQQHLHQRRLHGAAEGL